MAFTQPLDLYQIFVADLAGSMAIFIFLSIAFLAMLAAKFRIPNSIFMILLTLFCAMMSFYYPVLRIVTIILVGLFIFYIIASRTKT